MHSVLNKVPMEQRLFHVSSQKSTDGNYLQTSLNDMNVHPNWLIFVGIPVLCCWVYWLTPFHNMKMAAVNRLIEFLWADRTSWTDCVFMTENCKITVMATLSLRRRIVEFPHYSRTLNYVVVRKWHAAVSSFLCLIVLYTVGSVGQYNWLRV